MPTCKVPWISITLSGNGNIKPCCVYKGGDYSYHKGDTLESVWKDLDSLRKQFLDGEKPDKCQQCWDREKSLGTSRRMWYEDKITTWPSTYDLNPNMQLRHMDLNFGNKCNLKCRMCGSWGSTSWFNEEIKLHHINPDFQRNPNKSKPTIIPASYWEGKRDIFKYLERIDFKGGEPMMQEGMYTFLQYLIDWKLSKNITIAYTTNGTKTPNKLFELWPKFKKIKLVISIEGTGDLYQYIRGGKTQNINQLVKNIHWFDQFENLYGSFNSAIQIYNIFNLNDILEWMRDTVNASKRWHRDPNSFKFDCMVTDPKYLDINIMPSNLKLKALEKLTRNNYESLNYIKKCLMHDSYNEKQWNLFKSFTYNLDKMRNTNVIDVIPEFKNYL